MIDKLKNLALAMWYLVLIVLGIILLVIFGLFFGGLIAGFLGYY